MLKMLVESLALEVQHLTKVNKVSRLMPGPVLALHDQADLQDRAVARLKI